MMESPQQQHNSSSRVLLSLLLLLSALAATRQAHLTSCPVLSSLPSMHRDPSINSELLPSPDMQHEATAGPNGSSSISVSSPPDLSSLPTESVYSVHKGATYQPFTAFCFTVNYILGVGVLGTPYAFVAAGWFLSTVVLLVITIFSWVTGMWVVQVQERARKKLLYDYEENQKQQQQQLSSSSSPSPSLLSSSSDPSSAVDVDGLSAALLPVSSLSSSPSSPSASSSLLIHRRLELNELVGLFCGSRAQRVYECMLSILIIGALWAYGTVFAGSLAGSLPISSFLSEGEDCSLEDAFTHGGCEKLYFFYIGLYALIVVPLTCRELTELKVVMIILAIVRFVCLGLMMLTSIISIYSFPNTNISTGNPDYVPSTHEPFYSDIQPIVWAGISIVLPITISSQLFHHSIPNLSFPLRPQTKIPHVFTAVLCATFSLYASLGICVGLYYGSSTQSLCTLNWANYTGRSPSEGSDRSRIAAAVSYVIVLFPPIDVLSAFPLNAITLGNNLLTACVSPARAMQRRWILPFRLFASVFPLCGAMIVKDLGHILHYTGTVGVTIAFLFPALVQYYSQQAERKATWKTGQPNKETTYRRDTPLLAAADAEGTAAVAVSPSTVPVSSPSIATAGVSSAEAAYPPVIFGAFAAGLNNRGLLLVIATFAGGAFLTVVILSIIYPG